MSLGAEKHFWEASEITTLTLSCVRGSAQEGDNAHDVPYLNIDGQKAFLLSLSQLPEPGVDVLIRVNHGGSFRKITAIKLSLRLNATLF